MSEEVQSLPWEESSWLETHPQRHPRLQYRSSRRRQLWFPCPAASVAFPFFSGTLCFVLIIHFGMSLSHTIIAADITQMVHKQISTEAVNVGRLGVYCGYTPRQQVHLV